MRRKRRVVAVSEVLIRVTQLPVIDGLDALDALKSYWTQKAENMEALAPTDGNKSAIKKDRADARKEYETHMEAYMAARERAFAPIKEADERISECIKEPFARLDAAAKKSVDAIEGAQKKEKEDACREYFAELCAVHGVDFVKFEYMHLKINLSTSLNAYRDTINEWVAKVASGMDKIDRESDPADRDEIMSEYKHCLDVGEAMLRVQDHKNRLKAERQAAEEREERRKAEAEAVAKVEAAMPVAVSPPVEVKPEPMLTVAFKATATREKLIALREYMKAEGIKYE